MPPIGLKLYNNNIKLRWKRRRMKRIMNKIKQENKITKIILNREKYKDQGDSNIKVWENFVNMILRNNDVAPQVHNSISFL